MGVTITSHGQGASEAQVAEIESKISSELPHDYREFLLRQNGGRPSSNTVVEYVAFRATWVVNARLQKIAGEGLLAYLYSADKSSRVSWHEAYWGLVEVEQRIPLDTIPIGHDPGSNEILLGIRGISRGKVFFWLKDYASTNDDAEPTYENVGFIANSFTEFLESLYPWKEDPK